MKSYESFKFYFDFSVFFLLLDLTTPLSFMFNSTGLNKFSDYFIKFPIASRF